jgi:RNase adaptor protein for sRNA GlmZ degradation
MERLHATCVALPTVGGPLAVLLLGDSGAGKSDFALTLIDEGAWLVADDQVDIEKGRTGLHAHAVQPLTGGLEVRGYGVAEVPCLTSARLALAVELKPSDTIERLPDESTLSVLGEEIPLIAIDPAIPSAAARLRLALKARTAALGMPDRGIVTPKPARPQSDGGEPLPVVLVTGLSGAGRGTSLRFLEDMGYEAIDNLPLNLLGRAVAEGDLPRPVAVGIDIRNRGFAVQPLSAQIDELVRNPSLDVKLLFLDCDDEVLRRRFTETRRRHPLAEDRPLSDGLLAERRLLMPLRDRADVVLDTSSLPPPELRRLLSGALQPRRPDHMTLFVTSFSYRRGLPREADLVIDARFLRNPHYDPALRPLTGRDRNIADYIAADPRYDRFFQRYTDMLVDLLPAYEDQGRSYLTIAVGCTGGRHRSVAVAENLAHWLNAKGRPVSLQHRDLDDEDTARRDRAM